MTEEITQDELLRILSYCPETGTFKWKVRASRNVFPGQIAGNIDSKGYRRIFINKRPYKAARLAFFYVNGRWPTEHIDHINGNPADDRTANLREATRSENMANRKVNQNNKLGCKGVTDNGCGKYEVRIGGGNDRYVGTFATLAEAKDAYAAEAAKRYGDFAR